MQVSYFDFDYDIVMQHADGPRWDPPFNEAIAAGEKRTNVPNRRS